jgi:hypothetical protein
MDCQLTILRFHYKHSNEPRGFDKSSPRPTTAKGLARHLFSARQLTRAELQALNEFDFESLCLEIGKQFDGVGKVPTSREGNSKEIIL